MVDWSSPAVIEQDAAIFGKLMLAMLGLYSWEMLVTLNYDWSIFSGQRKFKYPMVFYFVCRYSLFLALIGLNVALNGTTKMNCQALYTFNQFAGNAAIATASTLLMLRTIAIWNRNPLVVVPLIVLAVGQWGILLHGVITVRASWSTLGNTCVVTGTLPVFLDLIYIYTMTYDLTVLVVSCIGLVGTSGRSDLWALLFKDGIVYFIVAFTANCLATVLLLLNLNPAMNIITTVPAAVASTIVACRGFVKLSTWATRDVYLPSHVQSAAPRPAVSMAGVQRKTTTGDLVGAKTSRLAPGEGKMHEGVHISMEAYTTADSRRSPTYKKSFENIEDDFESDTEASTAAAVRYTHSEHAQVSRIGTPGPPSAPVPRLAFANEFPSPTTTAASHPPVDNKEKY